MTVGLLSIAGAVPTGLQFNLILDPSWSSAPSTWQSGSVSINQAVALLSAAYPHVNATINLHVGYQTIWFSSGTPAFPVPANASQGSIISAPTSVPYATIRAAMAGLSFQSTTLATLLSNTPAGSSLNGQSAFAVPSACCKALGLFGLTGGPVSANDPTIVDGSIGIGSGWADAKILGVFLHEISHAMGRIESYAPFVFSRFTGVGTRDFSSSSSTATYFSINGGTTDLADYDHAISGSPDPADFLNGSDGTGVQDPLDCFSAVQLSGANQFLSTLDNQLMNAMGFQ